MKSARNIVAALMVICLTGFMAGVTWAKDIKVDAVAVDAGATSLSPALQDWQGYAPRWLV
jgi:hypothetical protein